jgi:hypothetical protein
MQHPAIFLKNRLDDLSSEASKSQGSWEASKILCLGGSIASWAAAATNPILSIFAIGSSLAYGWAIIKEGAISQRFKPLPMLPHTIGDLLNSAAGGEDESEPLPFDLRYLHPEQVTEFLLLDFQIQSVARFLSSIEESEREQAYKQLVKYFHHQYGAIAQHQPSLLFNSDTEIQEAFDSALSFPAFEPGGEVETGNEDFPAPTPTNQKPVTTKTPSPSNFPTQISIPEIEEIDIAEYLFSGRLGQDLKSISVSAESGGGKGNMIYGLSRRLLAAYPNARLFAINPKPDMIEAHFWSEYESVVLSTTEDEAIVALDQVKAAVDEMVRRQLTGEIEDPYVLVLDEYNTFRDLLDDRDLQQLTRWVSRICRQGRSTKVWTWVAMHSGNCKDVGMSAFDRTNLIRLAVGFQGNCDALQIAISNPAMFPGLKVAPGLISSLKTQGFGVGAASLFDKIFRIPNYLEQATPKKADRVQPVFKTALPDLPDEPESEDSLPSPEEEISAALKQWKVLKTSRKGIAIFKVWKWATTRAQPITLFDAVERFRKDRGKQLTKSEIHWSLEKLQILGLAEYLDSEQKTGTFSERTEQAP